MEIIEIIWLPKEMFWGQYSLISRICQLWLLLTCTNNFRVQINLLDRCRRLPVSLCAQMGAKWPFCIAEPTQSLEFKEKLNVSLAKACPTLGDCSLIKTWKACIPALPRNACCAYWEAGLHGTETTANSKFSREWQTQATPKLPILIKLRRVRVKQ